MDLVRDGQPEPLGRLQDHLRALARDLEIDRMDREVFLIHVGVAMRQEEVELRVLIDRVVIVIGGIQCLVEPIEGIGLVFRADPDLLLRLLVRVPAPAGGGTRASSGNGENARPQSA